MKKSNGIRITASIFLGLFFMLFLGACSEDGPTSTKAFPVIDSNTGSFEMEDDCVPGSYLLKIENVPELNNRLIISDFRNDPNVSINAYLEGSKIIIPKQSINLDGLFFSISGVAIRAGQKLDLSYTFINENLNKGNVCQARGFVI